MTPSQQADVVQEAAKSAPPVAITVATTVGGLSLNEWVAVVTIGYILLQAGWLVWKWYRASRDSKWKPD